MVEPPTSTSLNLAEEILQHPQPPQPPSTENNRFRKDLTLPPATTLIEIVSISFDIKGFRISSVMGVWQDTPLPHMCILKHRCHIITINCSMSTLIEAHIFTDPTNLYTNASLECSTSERGGGGLEAHKDPQMRICHVRDAAGGRMDRMVI